MQLEGFEDSSPAAACLSLLLGGRESNMVWIVIQRVRGYRALNNNQAV